MFLSGELPFIKMYLFWGKNLIVFLQKASSKSSLW